MTVEAPKDAQGRNVIGKPKGASNSPIFAKGARVSICWNLAKLVELLVIPYLSSATC
jgi:hypothetical protein